MAQKFNMEGTILRISDVKQITQNFKKRDFILEAGSKKYPNPVKFQLSGKHIDYADNRMINQKVEVEFYINGSGVKGKGYFVNLSAIAITYIRT